MSAIEVQLRDAVIGELNDPARNWDMEFLAVKTWWPKYGADELQQLKVSVVPLTLKETLIARTPKYERDYGIAIDLQMNVARADTDLMDRLTEQAESIFDFFPVDHFLPAPMNGWRSVDATRDNIYDINMLDTEGTWESLILVTFRGYV